MPRMRFPLPLSLLLALAALPATAQELLRNPGFDGEDGFQVPADGYALPGDYAWVYKGIGEIQSPTWWFPFWNDGPVPNQPEVPFRRPEYKVMSQRPPWTDPPRIDAGAYGCQYFGSFGAIDAGLFQQVAVVPGQRYRFQARGHCWSTCDDDLYQSGNCDSWDPTQGTLTVGIDPAGGTDYASPEIVWGEGAHIYDRYADIPAVAAEARGATLTVFIRCTYRWGYKHNDTFVDSASLVAVGPVPTPIAPAVP